MQVRRRIRRRISGPGLSADLAADINIAVSTGSGTTTATASSSQPIHQTGRSSAAGRDPQTEENP